MPEIEMRNYTINFGPQHPAAHGVLRLLLEMDGEVVERADPHIGLLHRGTEKFIEVRPYLQSIPYFDRLDYCSMLMQEHSFVLAVEKLLGTEVPIRAQYIRVLFDEITRILNHLLNVTTMALDVGAMTPLLWMFEEREKLMEFYEAVSGQRMHANYYRFGGVNRDLPDGLEERIAAWIDQFGPQARRRRRPPDREPDLQAAHRRHRRRQHRGRARLGLLRPLPARLGPALGPAQGAALRGLRPDGFRHPGRQERRLLGPLSRAHARDPRIAEDHAPVPGADAGRPGPGAGPEGDAAAARRDEALDGGADPPLQALHRGRARAGGRGLRRDRERKGEFGVYLVADGTNRPWRCKIRSPGYVHLEALDFMSKGHTLADVPAIIGSIDIVFGEIDR